MPRTRSAFGLLLRNHRRQRGLSQAALAHRIAAIVGEGADEQNGFLSEKAISNLEAPREPGEHVTPRVSTVVILARALGIERGTPVFDAFLGAATHKREQLTGTLDPAETPFGGVGFRPVVTAGREDEIQRLNAHLLDALAGTAQIVFLAGDSGIGKTFLINHFCRQAVASHPSLVVAIDDANSPSGLGEPYLPFKRLLALLSGDLSAAGSDQLLTGDHAERLRRLTIPAAETLIAHGPALVGPFVEVGALRRRVDPLAPRSAWWLPVLDRLSEETSYQPSDGIRQMHEQVARVLIELAKLNPIVLVLDDLHWADERTCDLLFYLARRLHGLKQTPLLIIGAFRLADLAGDATSGRHPLHRVINETQRYWGRIVIDLTNTVGNENGRLFIENLLDAEPNRLDKAFRSLLFERTEGHPLFVTELLQWMKTEGILVQEDGAWSMHRDVTIHELPPRIGALVAERLERLPRELLKTVRAASVQGLQFAAEVVAEVRHLSRRHIAGQLESLVFEHRLLIADPADHMGDGIHRYRFRHSLFQEYLEGSFAPFTRQALHIETAEAMLRVLPVPADAGLDIGRQFELGGDLHRACEWYLQAGDRSLREFDHESALRWFGHAIDQARRLDDQTLICRAAIGMGEALRAQGDIAAAIRVGYDALEASELARNRSLRAECLASLGVFFYDIGSNDQAENFLTEALALLGEEPGPRTATACAVHYLLSYTLYARGAYSTGVEHAHRALNLAREGNLTRQEGEALVAVAYYHVELGNYEAALAFYQSAMECQRAEKDFRGEAVSLLNIGLCHIEIGHFNDALGPLEQALRFGERTHRPRTQAAALTYLGFLHEGNEQWSRAAACYAAARQLRLGADQRQLAVDALAGMVRVALATGDDDTVRQDADQLLDWLSAHGTDGIEYPIRVYLTLVHAFRALDDQEQASAALAEGLRVLRVRAEQISDADLRRSFLERVPFNRALMTLATEPVGTPAPDGAPISLDGAPRG